VVAEDLESSEANEDPWKCYRMLGIVSADIPWNAISNYELQLSYKALRTELVLPLATTLRINCCRQDALTMDAIKK